MAADTVELVKERLSIVDVVSQYVKLERAGAAMKGRCPFHNERTPSFYVSPARGSYHCFGCGVGGDIFTFIEAIEGIDFKGALKMLAERAGVPLVYEKTGARDERDRMFAMLEDATSWFEAHMKENDAARVYLHTRGLTDGTIATFRIGWAPDSWNGLTDHLREKGFTDPELERVGLAIAGNRGRYDRFRSRIMFPISDSAGRVVAYSGRIFIPEGTRAQTIGTEEPAKYINSPETALFKKSRILYGYDRAKLSIRKHNCAILVEGQMDLVLSHQAGWSNTVAVSGTALTPEHVEMIKRQSTNLILGLDADQAGIAAAAKSARAALTAGLAVKVAAVPAGKDPADVIAESGPEAWKEIIRTAKPIVTFLLDVVEKGARDPEALRRNVLASVLPFAALMHSAVEREAMAREIANRIGVSETAVMSDLARLLAQQADTQAPIVATVAPVRPSRPLHTSRVMILWGIVLWQQSLPTPKLDTAALEAEVRRVAGEEVLASLMQIPPEEQERIRFTAEALHGLDEYLPKTVSELARGLERDRLTSEIVALTAALREAERLGNADEQTTILETIKERSEAIAKLDKLR